MRWFRLLLLCALALASTACKDKLFNDFIGGGSSSSGEAARGTLLQNPPQSRGVFTAGALLQQLGLDVNKQLLELAANPVCDIAIYHLQYHTVGGQDEATTASGALMVPTGGNSTCSGARPILLYAHGTSTDQAFDISNVMNDSNAEGIILAAFFASQGYIVVAPNYAGYDTSTLSYHPYLIADQQSKDMIDALTAARSALPAVATGSSDDGRLFLTGYSQGGYVAMATQRAMQDAGMTVTASAPLSGPYTLAAFVDAVFEGQVNADAPISWTLLATGYQQAYGDIYSQATDVFESQYANGIDTLLPGTLARSDLYAQGKLPQNALFNSTPPDPAFANITPATQPANLAQVFALGFGSNNLVTNSYRLTYLNDARANPDGSFPTTTSGIPAAAPQLSMRARLKQNDLRTEWTPTAPTLLCAGDSDPVVFFMNTEFMQGFWATRAPASLSVVDIDSGSIGDPYDDLRSKFDIAKEVVAAAAVAGGAKDGGEAAVLAAYHTTLVAPFCLAVAARFFAAQ
ncbi:MAG TPA: prolyl oligopeptidase family serine peptidase [Steroidobacteraceae bacterium]|jgi:alpha-beta hydrolase superfamily lysophospholipase